MEWVRIDPTSQERERLLGAMTAVQRAHLLEHDYVWVPKVGVLWNPVDGPLRRSRFTHGTSFETRRGEFIIDAEGSVEKRPSLREPGTRADAIVAAPART